MKTLTKITPMLAAAGLGLALAAAATTPSNAAVLQVGILNCAIGPSVGFIITTPAQMICTLYPSDGKPAEHYTGTVMKAGLGAGIVAGTALSWVVYDQQSNYATKGLAGTYAGGSAEASLGVGVGVNVLFGGSNESFVLTPLSVQGQVGVGGGVGITVMELSRV
jgi:Protein of unknown function (DUF992)